MGKKREGPKGCLFYAHSLQLLSHLDDERAGRVMKAAAAYFLTGEAPAGLDRDDMAFCSVVFSDVDDSLDRYRAVCDRNRARSSRSSLLPPGEYYVLPDREEN